MMKVMLQLGAALLVCLQPLTPVSAQDRFSYALTPDGWVSKANVDTGVVIRQVRVGIESRNLAVSGDGKFIAVANASPSTLVLLDQDLKLLREHTVRNKERTQTSRVLGVFTAASRRSFIAPLQDVAEIWEVSYDPTSDDVPIGVIHDFLYKEGAFISGFLNPQRTRLDGPLHDVGFTADFSEIIGLGTEPGKLLVVNLDARKLIAQIALPGSPRPGATTFVMQNGKQLLAIPDAHSGQSNLIDPENWQTVRPTQQ
jgi:hypothetical protein